MLCIATLADPSICRKTLGALREFVDATTPLGQSEQFGCLLDYICIANAGPTNQGTCNLLLESAGTFLPTPSVFETERTFILTLLFLPVDCIANRIIGTLDLECE